MFQGGVTMFQTVGQTITMRIFVAVQRLFERAIIGRDHARIRMGQPVFGIILRQCPAHDVQALVDNMTVAQQQHRNGALWRNCDHFRWFIPKHHFAQLNPDATYRNRHPCPHGVRASAETVEDRAVSHQVED